MKKILKDCISTRGIKVEELPTFDIEYLFLNIRGKSVGEALDLIVTCPDDNETTVPVKVYIDEIGIETNGTLSPPKNIDWVCVSPKAKTDIVITKGNELKIVYPQCGINPRMYEDLDFEHFFIQPMDGKNQKEAMKKSEKFVMKNPLWKLSLQTHKIMGIP